MIATSHSPYAIAWLKEEDYKFVFLCTKNEETGATSITPFSEIPRLMGGRFLFRRSFSDHLFYVDDCKQNCKQEAENEGRT